MATVTTDEHGMARMGWQVFHAAIPAVAAADATIVIPLMAMPFNCELGEVSLICSTLVTGNTTNTKNLNLIDGGAEGAGTAELANRDLITGTNLAAGKTMLFDNIIAAALEIFMSQGDMLELQVELVGTGVAVGPLVARIVIRPANLTS